MDHESHATAVDRSGLSAIVVAAALGVITVQPRDGAAAKFPADESGCFSIRPIPVGPFRLHCRAAAGIDAQTGWITL